VFLFPPLPHPPFCSNSHISSRLNEEQQDLDVFTAETNDDHPAGVSTAPIARAEPFSWWQLGVAPDEAERLLDNAVVGSFVIYDDTSRDNRFVLAHRPAAGPGVEGDGIERLYIGWVGVACGLFAVVARPGGA